MQDATSGLERLYECVASIDNLDSDTGDRQAETALADEDKKKIRDLEDRFQGAMDNDFNTAQAQGIFFDTVKTINRSLKNLSDSPALTDILFLKDAASTLKKLADIMGLLREDARLFLAARKQQLLSEITIDEITIKKLITERNQCRKEKNWSRSDEIRDELLENNIELKDGPTGTEWSIKRS